MSTDVAYLALLLDAPLQSWGFESRFQRRTTGLHPTKSGVIGMICAAMGLSKGSETEQDILPRLASLAMTSLAIPRRRTDPWSDTSQKLPVLRLEDFHTVLKTRRASGKENPDPVVARRQYLMNARFGVILSGDWAIVERVHNALRDPVWGIWFGRKSCIPAAPIARGVFSTEDQARRALIEGEPPESLTRVSEAEGFDKGTDTLNDKPLSFGDGRSSGSDARRFAPRRIDLQPGKQEE